jgi:hypothetical protein
MGGVLTMSKGYNQRRIGEQIPTSIHSIGGRKKDGRSNYIGAWTFECPQVRKVVEHYLHGSVLNACAGKTSLNYPETRIHRNDIDESRDADTHADVRTLDTVLTERFDTVVFDPPFDQEQAEEHYNGNNVGRGPSGGIWEARDALAELTTPGGVVLSIGWNSVGLSYKDTFQKEHIHLFQRICKPDVFLTVDRKIQRELFDESDGEE